jgi:hypothetical protein
MEDEDKKYDENMTNMTEYDGTKNFRQPSPQSSYDDMTINPYKVSNVKNNDVINKIETNEMEKVSGNGIIPSYRHNAITEEPEEPEKEKEKSGLKDFDSCVNKEGEEITGKFKVKALKEIPEDTYCGLHPHKAGEVFFVNEEQKDLLERCKLVEVIEEHVLVQSLEDMPSFVDFSGHNWSRGIRKGEIFSIDSRTAELLIKRGLAKPIGGEI